MKQAQDFRAGLLIEILDRGAGGLPASAWPKRRSAGGSQAISFPVGVHHAVKKALGGAAVGLGVASERGPP